MLIQELVSIAKFCQANAYSELKTTGLTSIEHTICMFIYLHENTNQDTISKAYLIDKATVAKITYKLQKQGILIRTTNPKNRRENLLSLTEDGKIMIKDAIDVFNKWTNEVLQDLSEEERTNLFDYLRRIRLRTMLPIEKK